MDININCLKGSVFKFTLILFLSIISTVSTLAQCMQGNCKNGTGTFVFESGAKYIGEFVKGKMVNGVYNYSNNDIYEGFFENNKRHGKGRYIYSDGRVFEGEFDQGKRSIGSLEYLDGSKYTGDFNGSKKHGKGTLHTSTGKIYSGYWENDAFLGEVPDNPIETYALIVAIEDYKLGDDVDLKYTNADAIKFKDHVKEASLGAHESHIKLLLDEEASKTNILKYMNELFMKADKNDKVIFYFSGHGHRSIFMPYDVDPRNSESFLYHSEIKKVFKKSKSKHKMLIADACFAGSMKSKKDAFNVRSFKEESDTNEKEMKEVQVAIMLSCSENETSIESGRLGQGVFSYFLIKGLNGEADINSNNLVSIEELYYYVRNHTYEFAKNNCGGHIQRPILYGKFDRDMTISIVR